MAIGGGTGLSALLRGLKEHTSNLTAVVTVADDGGSSGVLRSGLGHPAGRRHPELHRGPRRRRAAHERAAPVPLPGRDRGRGPRAWPATPSGNLLLAAMTAVEGGDFEEGVRRINRILAVRGQVVPVTGQPLTLHAELADGRIVDGQSSIMADDRHRARLADPAGRPRVRRRARGDRRGGSHRRRPGQPVHEPAAEPAAAGHPRRAAGGARAGHLRLQRRDPGRRDGRLRPRRARRGARRPHRAADHRRGPGQQPVRGEDAVAAGAPSTSACAGRRPSSRSRASSSTTSWTRPTPITTTRPGWPTRSCGRSSARVAPADERSAAAPDDEPRRTRSRRGAPGRAGGDRSRPTVRPGRRSGRPGRRRGRPRRTGGAPGRATAAHDDRRSGDRRVPLGGRRGALPLGLAARPVPGPRLAEPGQRPDPPRVRRAAGRGAGPGRAPAASWTCPRRGGSAVVAGS